MFGKIGIGNIFLKIMYALIIGFIALFISIEMYNVPVFRVVFSILFVIFISIILLGNTNVFNMVKKRRVLKNINLQDIPVDFMKIYDEIPKEILKKIRLKRNYIIINYSVFILVSIYLILKISSHDDLIRFVRLLGNIIVICCVVNKILIYQYIKLYKEEIFGRMIKQIYSQYNYFVNSIEDIKNNKNKMYEIKEIINCSFRTKILENDKIEGQISPIQSFNISNISLFSRNVYIGTQLFVSADLLKNINGSTIIVPSNRSIFRLNQDKLINLDYNEFDSLFDVFSTDEKTSNRIVTTNIMDSIIEFYNKYNIDFEITYKNNKVYFYFITKELFEPKLYGEIIDFKSIYMHKLIIDFVIDSIEKTNAIIKKTIV